MKKIIFIHYGGGIGGAPISMLDLASSLDKTEYNILIIFSSNGPIVNIARKRGFNTKVINFKSVFFYGSHIKFRISMLFNFLWNYFATIRQMNKLIKDEKPSLIYLNTSVLVTIAIAIRKNKIPIVWSVREVPGANSIIRKWHINKIEKLSNHIIFSSKYVMNYFNDSPNNSVLHNSVNIENFRLDKSKYNKRIRNKYNIENNAILLCMIGSVQYEKGHFLLIEAIKLVKKKYKNFQILIIAGGINDQYKNSLKGKIKRILRIPYDNLDKMKKVIEHNSLEKHFVFTGYVTEIPKILCAVDVVLFPSLMAEGFGRPILEGMASGVPVIASGIGPSKEILGENAGLLLQRINSKELANSINYLISNSELRREKGKAGFKRVSISFESGKIKKTFNNIIRKQISS